MIWVTGIFRVFETFGFDRPKLVVGLQVALVALTALCIAWGLRLEHPQWAAITVFLTLQPTRGQIVEKSSYRFIGTLCGSLFGALVAWAGQGNLAFELFALCFWSAAMTFTGALMRSYRSYATLLSGYSAIIVIVLNPFNPETVLDVAGDRIVTVLIGALAAVLWAAVSGMKNGGTEVGLKARRLAADTLQRAGQALRDPDSREIADFGRLMSAAGLLRDELHTLTANGRFSGTRRIEQMLTSLTDLLIACWQEPQNEALGAKLEELGTRLRGQSDYDGLARALRRSHGLTENRALEQALTALSVSLEGLQDPRSRLDLKTPERHRYELDWSGAAQGALRIFLVLFLISLGWLLSESALFQYPLVSAAICVALATTGVTPRRKMVDVIKGQAAAGLVAVLVEMLLWPLFPTPLGQLLCLIPAALIFGFLRAHRFTSLSAPDYAIVVFLLLSPGYLPYTETYSPALRASMAVGGSLLGYLAFLVIFPTDARERRKALWRMIKADMQQTAVSRSLAVTAHDWRQSFAGRFQRIAHWAAIEQGRYEREAVTMRKGLVTMELAEIVFMLRGLQQRAGLSPSLHRAITATLERVGVSRTDTYALIRSLQRLAGRLRGAGLIEEADLVGRGLHELSDLQRLRRETAPE
ncbi:FUSC family protein [Falsigemmobacter faecalis]|uniref:FUSC family protein n=1 Tax=Falsigemmobacter faecalis TaxID=2488730 RepID=A0A3P3DHW3_9RHOB|nr:FUSC family protein [Falsigemmobacter faecalis]RRH73841.1 hypothetical protein EG244_12285 [Falsigemmobacter faecalis]